VRVPPGDKTRISSAETFRPKIVTNANCGFAMAVTPWTTTSASSDSASRVTSARTPHVSSGRSQAFSTARTLRLAPLDGGANLTLATRHLEIATRGDSAGASTGSPSCGEAAPDTGIIESHARRNEMLRTREILRLSGAEVNRTLVVYAGDGPP
jgi:hypothetical protein